MVHQEATFKEWMSAQFNREQLEEIARYGCQDGYAKLTYDSDTGVLYAQYNRDIWELLDDCAKGTGYSSVLAMLDQTQRFKCADSASFETHLVWLAAELVAWELTHPGLTGAIIGIRSEIEAEQMVGGLGWRLAREDIDEVERALAASYK